MDEKGGPNHVGNYCQAPFLFDREEKKLMPQLIAQYFEHFSGVILEDSVRIGFSRYTDELEVTSFLRPDHRLAVVFLNRSEKILPVHLRLEGKMAAFLLYPNAMATGIIS